MPNCKMCRERSPKELAWFTGSQPRCAFVSGIFSPDNWNCATAGAIRTICSEYDREDLPQGVSRTWHEDQHYATILIVDAPRPEKVWFGDVLFVQWYKSRGRTEEMTLLGTETPRRPSEAECLAIIEHYQDRSLWPNGHPDDEDEEECLKASA